MQNTATTKPTPILAEQDRPKWWNSKKTQKRIGLWIATILILIGAFVLMVPLAWMITTSLKADGEVFIIPICLTAKVRCAIKRRLDPVLLAHALQFLRIEFIFVRRFSHSNDCHVER